MPSSAIEVSGRTPNGTRTVLPRAVYEELLRDKDRLEALIEYYDSWEGVRWTRDDIDLMIKSKP